MQQKNVLLFSEENLLAQIQEEPYQMGFFRVKFYAKNGLPALTETDLVSEFYLYPSGGSLRDANFNIVFYSSKFDTYRGFVIPQIKQKN